MEFSKVFQKINILDEETKHNRSEKIQKFEQSLCELAL